MNIPYRPVDLKVRGSLGWSRDGLTATAFINYIDSYHDNRPASEGPISSWTTIDATLSYAFEEAGQAGLTDGLQLLLSVQNLFNQDPPFVSGANGTNFDSTNANPLGRFVSVEVRKQW